MQDGWYTNSKLRKHKVGKSYLTFKKLQDINLEVFEQIIKAGLEKMDKYSGV